MEFFEGWAALNSRLDNSDLPALTRLVALKLYAISDEQRFPDVFCVSDRELISRTGISSGQTIVDARRRLKNAGLIDFTTQPRKLTQYRWTLNQSSKTQAKLKQNSSANQAVEANSYIRVRDPYTPNPYPLNQSIDARENQAKETTADELDALLEYWEHDLHGGRLSFEHQSRFSALLQEKGSDWLKAAMKEAADANNNPRGFSPKFLFGVIARKAKEQPTLKENSASKYTNTAELESMFGMEDD